jgi:hypothetical protein
MYITNVVHLLRLSLGSRFGSRSIFEAYAQVQAIGFESSLRLRLFEPMNTIIFNY